VPDPAAGRFNLGAALLRRGWLAPAVVAAGIAGPYACGERWRSDAGYYVAIALKAAREGRWWTLAQGDLPYFNKPPGVFWAHAASVLAFGERDWAYRLPEVLAYVLTVVGVAGLGSRLYGRWGGVAAGLAMALAHDWVWRIGNVRLDFAHTMFLVLAAWCWAVGFGLGREGGGAAPARRVWTWAALAGVCVGGALMCKPLIALAWPCFGGAWLACCGRLDRRAAGALWVSWGVGAAVALPWHLSMVVEHGRAFVDAYVVTQSYKRAVGAMFDPEPWWWYFAHFAGVGREGVSAWPMGVHYGLALAGLGAVAAARFPRATRAGDALGALWAVAWLVALSAFADKRNYYALVLHPGTSLLIAAGVVRGLGWVESRRGGWGERGMRVAATLTLVGGVALVARWPWAVARARRDTVHPEREALAAFVRAHAGEPVYDGGLIYQDAAVLYVKSGVWPRWEVEKEPVARARIPAGALAVYGRYHELGEREPGEREAGDEVVFEADGAFARYWVVRVR
jgi:4-amino-4-deoxy-L-arabinose transferase-like glycosyltransferase